MEERYEFTPDEAIKLGEELNTFGRVKLDTLKKYLRKKDLKTPEASTKKTGFKKEVRNDEAGKSRKKT